MKQKKWVVFDVDDVLLNFVENLYLKGHEHNLIKTNLHWKDWDSYNHLDYFKHDNQDDFRSFMVKEKVIEGLQPFPEVASVLQELQKSYNLGFLTSRGYHPQAVEVTRNSLFNHFGVTGKIVIAGLHGMKKTDFIPNFEGEIVAYVDDAIMHVQDFNKVGIKAALRNQLWNKNDKISPRVNDMREFLNFIKS